MSDQVSAAPLQRPTDYASLLREPISLAKGQGNYSGWEFDHGQKQRFYVGGIQWFMRVSGIQLANEFIPYGTHAAEEAVHNTSWPDMPSSGSNWNDCSEIQFRKARNIKPMFFQKAALVLLSCELALADRIRTGRVRDKAVSVLDVYQNMKVIPACWHIDDFDRATLKRLTEYDKDAPTRLRDAADQTAKTYLDHMATGHTVTLKTARLTKAFLDEHHQALGIGNVNARPANGLGKLHATEYEHINAG